MTKRIGFLTLAALAAGIFLAQAADRKDAYTVRDEADVLKLQSQWTKAAQEGDTAAMERILAPEYTGVNPDGSVTGKNEEIAIYRKGDLKFDSIKSSEQKVKVYIGSVMVTGKSTVKGKHKDQDISGDYRFVDVFERKPGGWQVVYSQITKVESEEDKKKRDAKKQDK